MMAAGAGQMDTIILAGRVIITSRAPIIIPTLGCATLVLMSLTIMPKNVCRNPAHVLYQTYSYQVLNCLY